MTVLPRAGADQGRHVRLSTGRRDAPPRVVRRGVAERPVVACQTHLREEDEVGVAAGDVAEDYGQVLLQSRRHMHLDSGNANRGHGIALLVFRTPRVEHSTGGKPSRRSFRSSAGGRRDAVALCPDRDDRV